MDATPKYLLEGLYYALIQCGRLLTSAATLYKAGDHATAVGLAALSREEFGRSRQLRKLRAEVVQGKKTFSVAEIRDACNDHVMKQQWGLGSTLQRFDRDSGFGKLLEERRKEIHQLKPGKSATKQVDKITEDQRDRTPQDRHDERMKALYVEPNASDTGWNKPWERDRGDAKNFIQHAINDYAMQINNALVLDILKLDDPELAQAIKEWKKRPDLPPPPVLP